VISEVGWVVFCEIDLWAPSLVEFNGDDFGRASLADFFDESFLKSSATAFDFALDALDDATVDGDRERLRDGETGRFAAVLDILGDGLRAGDFCRPRVGDTALSRTGDICRPRTGDKRRLLEFACRSGEGRRIVVFRKDSDSKDGLSSFLLLERDRDRDRSFRGGAALFFGGVRERDFFRERLACSLPPFGGISRFDIFIVEMDEEEDAPLSLEEAAEDVVSFTNAS
jgi:hypothetical protein